MAWSVPAGGVLAAVEGVLDVDVAATEAGEGANSLASPCSAGQLDEFCGGGERGG